MKRQHTMSAFEFHQQFPDEAAAVAWFESIRWPEGRCCPKCDSTNIAECKNKKPQPYRCRMCRKHFSCTTDTVMHSSNLSVRQWLYAMYLISVSKKGLSSCQLARELGIAQESAWRLGHKIREEWNQDAVFPLNGTIEVDETYMGGKEKNKHESQRKHEGRGGVGKQAVVGLKSRKGEVRAFPIDKTDASTLQGSVRQHVEPGSTVYTDGHLGYVGMREYRQESVAHSAGEYVRDQVHTNGIESFWSLLKRGYVGTFHQMSVKHLSRYVDEFCFRWNHRHLHTLEFMRRTIEQMEGQRLPHYALVGRMGV